MSLDGAGQTVTPAQGKRIISGRLRDNDATGCSFQLTAAAQVYEEPA